ncbi:Retrovirus-related Pol polyprotein from transposon TNT 1-94 [Formica fusca]
MLHAANLPRYLWAEAVATAVYILNRRTSTQTKGTTPYEMWTRNKPCLTHVKVFGSTAYAHIPKQQCTKWDPRAEKLILVGYESESTNYRLFNPVTKKITVLRNVIFNEGDEEMKHYDPLYVVGSSWSKRDSTSGVRASEIARAVYVRAR